RLLFPHSDLRTGSRSFEARKEDVALEMGMLGKVGCELVEAQIERARGIAGILRRLEAVRQCFDGAHLLAMMFVLVAHDCDRAEERTGEPVAYRRKKNPLLLRHVIQQVL